MDSIFVSMQFNFIVQQNVIMLLFISIMTVVPLVGVKNIELIVSVNL